MSLLVLDDAINRSYYAIFTGARSLLALFGMDSRKHSGIISLFNRNFIKTGILPKHLSKIITTAREGRESSDYADFIEHTGDESEAQYKQAKEFLAMIQEINDKIIKNEIVIHPSVSEVRNEK